MSKYIKHNKIVTLPMYNCKVHFIITDSLKTLVNDIYKKNKLTDVFEAEAEGVLVTLDITNYYLIIDLKYLSYNTLAHELYHAVVRVTEDRDIVDEETQAWLAGHLTGTMYKFLEKKNLPIKHG